jgi:RNA polymerase sigma factor for flagellar operon FliA
MASVNAVVKTVCKTHKEIGSNMPQAIKRDCRPGTWYNQEAKELPYDVLSTVWDEYQATGSADSRDKLILHYLSLVKVIASSLIRTLPMYTYIQMGDLVASGVTGLVKCLPRFEQGQGSSFSSYASHRIKGQMLDDMRKLQMPRGSQREKIRTFRNMREKLTSELERHPHITEVFEALGWTDKQGYNILKALSSAKDAESLQKSIKNKDGEITTHLETLAIPNYKQHNPFAAEEIERIRNLLLHELDKLGPRTAYAVKEHYFNGRTLKSISVDLDITASRVCQITTDAIRTLQKRLQDRREEFMILED